MREDIKNMVLQTYQDLYDNKAVDEITLREVKTLCLPKIKAYSSATIRQMRRRFKLSQAALARFLNVSNSTVQKWEIGEKHPSGPAEKLLYLLDEKGIQGLI
ncbi:MAG: helix-turn-helix domain-containing protein [Candidatus Omnitrophica bacterium]|nr:helix-turn-helix domain-containing protein [Candidatus Omnitrophota bacterium]